MTDWLSGNLAAVDVLLFILGVVFTLGIITLCRGAKRQQDPSYYAATKELTAKPHVPPSFSQPAKKGIQRHP